MGTSKVGRTSEYLVGNLTSTLPNQSPKVSSPCGLQLAKRSVVAVEAGSHEDGTGLDVYVGGSGRASFRDFDFFP
jgi:hypothetical protein